MDISMLQKTKRDRVWPQTKEKKAKTPHSTATHCIFITNLYNRTNKTALSPCINLVIHLPNRVIYKIIHKKKKPINKTLHILIRYLYKYVLTTNKAKHTHTHTHTLDTHKNIIIIIIIHTSWT